MNRERQRKNEQAYRDKNAGRPRLPGTYLTEQESELLKKLATICGTQKKLFLPG
ncbi:hypothetical protein H3T61_01105 [Gilliamella sp. B14384H2]|uniref:hypothetical protein n=1 Tax=unclassified Gilliamella TaxID=2685620 RepID=UPI0018DD1D08|nr:MULTISPECIES: hypothetical protein [unclassified Gilliamella]MBI0036833.1 hypothetical protein [Gilliamella sp. B14384G10]MBI0039513.1 hypothetical protein [Gilliamella sp. B14384G7]MBI0050828.1 hypothetical protein [Gilliamella sp. B14384G13]MBI0053120.1 hypothetical protein [Gilliamella sp. B14384H2]